MYEYIERTRVVNFIKLGGVVPARFATGGILYMRDSLTMPQERAPLFSIVVLYGKDHHHHHADGPLTLSY